MFNSHQTKIILRRFFILMIIVLLWKRESHCSPNDSIPTIKISGLVKDSSLNYFLDFATIIVEVDSLNQKKILGYTLTNQFGYFELNIQSINPKLNLRVSMISYKELEVPIPNFKTETNVFLDTIYISKSEETLSEVIVSSIIPIRMKGDTLEFNPRAFEVDSLAVVEDLLKKIPGFTIWADGVITLNGKEIKDIYVDGKRFLGGSSKTATQNLPVNLLDKIQVYSESSALNPLDSIHKMNIKLKKNSSGLFGKVYKGLGTNKSKDFGLLNNYFDQQNQASIFLNSNNLNKKYKSRQEILEDNTFVDNRYKALNSIDVSQKGINNNTLIGFFFERNFKNPDKPSDQKNAQIEYTFNRLTTKIAEDEKTRINNLSLNFTERNTERSVASSSMKHHSAVNFEEKRKYLKFNIGYQNSFATSNSHLSETVNTNLNDTINQNRLQSNKSINNSFLDHTLQFNLSTSDRIQDLSKISKTIDIIGRIGSSQKNNNKAIQNTINYFDNSVSNSLIDRNYEEVEKSDFIELKLNYPFFDRLFQGPNPRRWRGFHIGLQQDIKITSKKFINKVDDLLSSNSSRITNDYLTNNQKIVQEEYFSGMEFSKNFGKSLSNRYQKDWKIILLPRFFVFKESSNSKTSFQNVNRALGAFTPVVKGEYNYTKFGVFHKTLTIESNKERIIPDFFQLFPLIDSINAASIFVGNSNLSSATKRYLNVAYTYRSNRPKENLVFQTAFRFINIKNAIIDSIFIDNNGRFQYSLAQNKTVQDFQFINFFKKTFPFNNRKLDLSIKTDQTFKSVPSYFNGTLVRNKIFLFNSMANASFFWSENITIDVYKKLINSLSFQQSKDNLIKNNLSALGIAFFYKVSNHLSVGTNGEYFQNRSSFQVNPSFVILNADVKLRFLKNRQAEFSLSAFDLLKQNKGVFNFTNNYSQTAGRFNQLQQYFLLKFTYFPRFFKHNNN